MAHFFPRSNPNKSHSLQNSFLEHRTHPHSFPGKIYDSHSGQNSSPSLSRFCSSLLRSLLRSLLSRIFSRSSSPLRYSYRRPLALSRYSSRLSGKSLYPFLNPRRTQNPSEISKARKSAHHHSIRLSDSNG